ncbi:DUF3995 domain-containing protein [Nonomuraea sediminis]|uniref:DUF3995 domain-containing protein n=1 Tax=Nonomuraea sediminis TaxID=2835864 RepID=UPI001BDCB0E3|nr:DUF3995 domain-containing protein [Nonomuraea sediminis]
MRDRTRVRAGMAVAAVLAADAAVHVYWMTGSTWPAQDPESLSLAVLNVVFPFTPRVLLVPLTAAVCASALMAVAVGRPAWPARRIPARVRRLGGLLVATGILIRGLAGLVWAFGIGASPSTPFYWLNLLAYTPACLALFTAAVIATRTTTPAVATPVGGRPLTTRGA